MWLTVFFIYCIKEALSEVESNAQRFLLPEDCSHPSQESQANWRRLDSNNWASRSSAGVDFQRRVVKIGEIVGCFLSVIIILLIMIPKILPKILPWWIVSDVIDDLQTSDKVINTIKRSSTILLPPIDEEELLQVHTEYKRLSALLKRSCSDDFTRSKGDVSVFSNTTPVVIPFVRKPVSGNKSSIGGHKKPARKSPSTAYIFSDEEKWLVSDKKSSGSFINFTHGKQLDSNGCESTEEDKLTIHKQDTRLHLSRYQSKGREESSGTATVGATRSPKQSSVLSSIMSRPICKDSHGYTIFL
jgi:hypothetical protein